MESGVFYHAGCKRFPMKHRWIFQPVMKPRQCAILSAPLLLILWLPALIAGFPGFFHMMLVLDILCSGNRLQMVF